MVARCSRDSWTDASGVAAQAFAIQERAIVLARADAEAWDEASGALRDAQSGAGDDERRDFALETKLERAAAVPLEIASLGADAAALASIAGKHGEGSFRADAAAAAALAAGGARAAAHLVEVNLGVGPGDSRLAQARASEQAANDAAEHVLEPLR